MLAGRRAQIYIFAALVLCVLIYSVYSNRNSISQAGKTGKSLPCSEFIREYPKVIDYSLASSKEAPALLSNFTEDFLNYSATLDRGFGLMYALSWNGALYVKASFPEESSWEAIVYGNESASLLNLSEDYNTSMEGIKSLELYFANESYEMLPENSPSISVFCVSENGGNRDITFRRQ